MASVGPEWAWGLVLLAAGLAALHGIVVDDRRLRRWAAWVMAVLWAFIVIGVVLSNPAGTGWIPYGGFTLLAGWAALRLPAEVRRRV